MHSAVNQLVQSNEMMSHQSMYTNVRNQHLLVAIQLPFRLQIFINGV